MSIGSPVKTLDVLIKYTMSPAVAVEIRDAFIGLSNKGESVSYLDCILFDAALEVLGEEQAYYSYSDEEWQDIQDKRKKAEKRYGRVRTIDVTDTWREVMG